MTYDPTPAMPQYRFTIEIEAPIEKCFAGSTAESAMMHWVTGVKSVVYDHANAAEPYSAGSERTVTVGFGRPLVERITESVKPISLSYGVPTFGAVGDKLIQNYRVRMTFTAVDRNRTKLTWEGYFACPTCRWLMEPLLRKVLGGMTAKMANNLKIFLQSS
jgi:hypothetical protein